MRFDGIGNIFRYFFTDFLSRNIEGGELGRDEFSRFNIVKSDD